MNIKKHIPNFLTCCNLFCGCLGIIKVLETPWQLITYNYLPGNHYQNLVLASFLIFLACIFDFLDGFAARILKVTSSIGKELDSLADMVTFGVLPGIIMYRLLIIGFHKAEDGGGQNDLWDFYYNHASELSLIALIIPVFSALRLAKFNIDTRQSESFIGVPTPANAILIASFPLIINQGGFMTSILTNAYCLLPIAFIMSYLLVAELPLFALKFKDFSWTNNKIRYIFLGLSLVLLILLQFTAIPIIIFLYVILSFIENTLVKPQKS